MGLFRRRKETLNEQLLREAGLDPAHALGHTAAAPTTEAEPDATPFVLPPPRMGDVSLGWMGKVQSGTTEWDTCVTATVPALAGDRVEFTTLPNGDVIVDEESGDADLAPLADAIERHIDPPYRAAAERHDGDLWAVGAKRIAVAKIPFPSGDRLELSRNGDDEELRVDGEPSDALVPPALERVGDAAGDSFYVEAARIDGDLWEVRATAL
jgi:hypothetical protein